MIGRIGDEIYFKNQVGLGGSTDEIIPAGDLYAVVKLIVGLVWGTAEKIGALFRSIGDKNFLSGQDLFRVGAGAEFC